METLNPRLYEALIRKYGDVEIVNHCQQAYVTYLPRYASGKVRLTVDVTGGEYYKVRCRICRDHRSRLWFNYLFGTSDQRTGQKLLHVVICYNEDCVDTREVQQQLHDSLFTGIWRRRRRRQQAPSPVTANASPPPIACEAASPPRRIRLPQNCLPVNLLEPEHEARLYLEGREFDARELWDRWRVYYCACDLDASPKIYNRIVVPIDRRKTFVDKESTGRKWGLAGWQARCIRDPGPDDGIPKYLTAKGMSKSGLLYGLPHAIDGTGPVVLVEGVTDVWRLGRDAVATFGKTLSVRQAQQMVSLFEARPIVVAYDADASEQSRKACSQLRSARQALGDDSPVVIATLPRRYGDIGDCSRKTAWKIVKRAVNTDR